MTNKNEEIKKRQHYVWAHYLKKWGNGTSNVYYSSKKSKIANDSVKAIAFDNYFYKTKRLSDFDIEVIKTFSNSSPSVLQEIHMGILERFIRVQVSEDIYRNFQKRDENIERLLEVAQCNELEGIHTEIELRARKVTDALTMGNLEILNDSSEALNFFQFLGHQITRTKSFKDKAILGLKRDSDLEKAAAISMENSWWILSFMWGINVGTSLFNTRKAARISLLRNSTETPFIAGDQPIVNVHSSVSEDEIKAPEYGDFFYPLSPHMGIIISDSERFENGVIEVDEETVDEFNKKIASQAVIHIIGNSIEALKPYMKHIGTRYKKIISYKETYSFSR